MTNFCGTCGTKFVPGSKFCGICGTGVVSQRTPPSPGPATVEFVPPSTSPTGAGIGKKLAIAGAALFVALIVIVIVRQASSEGKAAVATTEKDGTVTRTAAKNVSKSGVIDVVRNGILTGYDSTTVGKAFEGTFQNAKWTSFETPKGATMVEFNGEVNIKALRAGGFAVDSFYTPQGKALWESCGGTIPTTPANEAATEPCVLAKDVYSPVKFQFLLSSDATSFQLNDFDPAPFRQGGPELIGIDRAMKFIYH